MKYINHMTCAFQDEKIQAAVAVGGLKVYAAYWVLVEAIAAQIRPESISVELTLTWVQWGGRLGVDPRNARKLTAILKNSSVILLQDLGKSATIKIPNILKYADEYTKRVCQKSGQTPDTTRDKVPAVSGSPALPALQDKKDLKILPSLPVDNSPRSDGANDGGDGLGATPPSAPRPTVPVDQDPGILKAQEDLIRRRKELGIPETGRTDPVPAMK